MYKRFFATAATAALVIALLSGCSKIIISRANLQSAAPSRVSSTESVVASETDSKEALTDWVLSAIGRNTAYAGYMTMKEYDNLFGTSGMMPGAPAVSPDGKHLAYIYPNEFEEPCDLYLYDVAQKDTEKILEQKNLSQTQAVKSVEWNDDKSLLLIIGYRYGTVSPGGEVCLLEIAPAPKLRLLYKPEKENEQVLSATLTGTKLGMTIAVFDSNFEKYTEEKRSITVDPAFAPEITDQAGASSVEADKIVAVIKNFPTQEQIAQYKNADTYEYDQSGESMLLIPKHNGTQIIIETMVFDDKKSDFVPAKTVYDKTSGEGYALYLKAMRPEGGPQLRITIKYGQDVAEYYVTYNGKDGNDADENITSK